MSGGGQLSFNSLPTFPLEPMEAMRRNAERRKTLKEIAELKPCIWIDLSPDEVTLLENALVALEDLRVAMYAIPEPDAAGPKIKALRARLRVARGDAE